MAATKGGVREEACIDPAFHQVLFFHPLNLYYILCLVAHNQAFSQ